MSVGRLRVPDRGVAVMGDDLQWHSRDAALQAELRRRFPVPAEITAADGWPGVRQIHAAHLELGGTVEIDPRPEAPEGVVY